MDAHGCPKYQFLRTLDLLSPLSDGALLRLSRKSELLHFCAKTPVWITGFPSTLIFIVVQGRLKLAAHPHHSPGVITETLTAGQLAITAEMLRSEPCATSATALEDTTLIGFRPQHLRQLLAQHYLLFYAVAHEVFRRQHHYMSRLRQQSPAPVERTLSAHAHPRTTKEPSAAAPSLHQNAQELLRAPSMLAIIARHLGFDDLQVHQLLTATEN